MPQEWVLSFPVREQSSRHAEASLWSGLARVSKPFLEGSLVMTIWGSKCFLYLDINFCL